MTEENIISFQKKFEDDQTVETNGVEPHENFK